MTLVELYRTAFTQQPRRDAFRFKANGAWHDVSSASALQWVEAVAAALHKLGIQSGDRVAILYQGELKRVGEVADIVREYNCDLEQAFLRIIGYAPNPASLPQPQSHAA